MRSHTEAPIVTRLLLAFLPKATILRIRVKSCEERGMALCPTLGHTLSLETPPSTFHVSKCLMETASLSSAQSRNS